MSNVKAPMPNQGPSSNVEEFSNLNVPIHLTFGSLSLSRQALKFEIENPDKGGRSDDGARTDWKI
jgi:hypothetical protein